MAIKERKMSEVTKSNWVLVLSFLFIMANSALIAIEQYWFAAVPFAIALLAMAFVATDKLMWFIIFATPLSINLEELNLGFGQVGMFLPTEPLLFVLMIIFFLKLLYERKFDREVIYHPISIAIYIYLGWILITTLTSTMFFVSLKSFLAKLWFIITFYFIGSQLYKSKKNILTFAWLYLIPLVGVAIYTFIHHSTYGFQERPAHWVMQPFFKDHTVYGAVVAMMFPISLMLISLKRYTKFRLITVLMATAIALGIVFSYGRAAWISLLVGLIVSLIYIFKLRYKFVLSLAGLVILFTVVFWSDIMNLVEKNTIDSTSENLTEHVQSIANISTDASNLERINRWNSAIEMFKRKPIFGWGPGTYTFQYAPFQSAEDLTIISTNAGDGGNAHSEFIGPLSESGLLGMLTFLLVIVVFYYRATVLYYKLPPSEIRSILLFVLIAFTTYIVNGMLNNFLDTDKASVPFWTFVAIVVVIDLHWEKMLSQENEQVKK